MSDTLNAVKFIAKATVTPQDITEGAIGIAMISSIENAKFNKQLIETEAITRVNKGWQLNHRMIQRNQHSNLRGMVNNVTEFMMDSANEQAKEDLRTQQTGENLKLLQNVFNAKPAGTVKLSVKDLSTAFKNAKGEFIDINV